MFTSKSLLPVGEDITFGNRRLRIIKQLSTGLTGEVYKAQLLNEDESVIDVAVKAMKQLEFAMARQLFEQESQTLAMMQGYEEEAGKKERLALKVAPAYYGRSQFNDVPYFVMEFIKGVELPHLLETQADGKLPEAQALTLAWHLYRTLDIMHTRLKKTYIDLKFEDLWLVSDTDNDGGQLKLTDFGTLEDVKESQRGVKRDLLLAAVYLFTMLTGHTLDYSLGRLQEPAEHHIRQYGVGMSWGTRQLLFRTLHRNQDVRPTNAAEVANELRILVNFWNQPAEQLLNIAEVNLGRAEDNPDGEKVRNYATRARAALAIAGYLGVSNEGMFHTLIERAENILALSSYRRRGRTLFDDGDYQRARQVFEEGMHWSDDPGVLRRWAYAARIGEEIGEGSKLYDQYSQIVVTAVKRLNEGKLQDAWDILEQLPRDMRTATGYVALQVEYEQLTNRERAQEILEEIGDDGITEDRHYDASVDPYVDTHYKAAAEAYGEAWGFLKQLPDFDFVRAEEIGDLRPMIERLEKRDRTWGQAKRGLTNVKGKLQSFR